MGHQLCSSKVDSEKSFLSFGFTCAGLSSASQNFCQPLELSSKCRDSAISCSARTHALSNIKFVMFTPRRSAPRRISLASLSLTRTLNLSVRLFRAVAGMGPPCVRTPVSSHTYNVRLLGEHVNLRRLTLTVPGYWEGPDSRLEPPQSMLPVDRPVQVGSPAENVSPTTNVVFVILHIL